MAAIILLILLYVMLILMAVMEKGDDYDKRNWRKR